MVQNEDDFLKKLLVTFRIEAQEHIASISSGLIELEKTPEGKRRAEIIETVFREIHSLKGASRAVNSPKMETVCQSLENVFGLLKKGKATLTKELFDLLHRASDLLNRLLPSTDRPGIETTAVQPEEVMKILEALGKGPVPAERKPVTVEPESSKETTAASGTLTSVPQTESVRISTAKLDALLLRVEELLATKMALGRYLTELRALNEQFSSWNKEWFAVQPEIRSKTSSSRKSQVFLDHTNHFAGLLEKRISDLAISANQEHRFFDRVFGDIREEMKGILMLSFTSFLSIFSKLVRDLARDQGKEAELTIKGGEIEIDRRVLEEIKDPLIHLFRNCIDHGIEKPEERTRKNKPVRGMITLVVSRKNSQNVEIQVSDDGAGIYAEKVKSAGLKQGLITARKAKEMTEGEVLALVFHSGISTSPIVTDLSGRGLGLAIVREKLEKIGGTATLESEPDKGTTVRLVFPVTLTAFRGVLVKANERLFILPLANVEQVKLVKAAEIKTVQNRATIPYKEETIPLVRLEDALGIPGKRNTDSSPAIVLASAGKRIAFMVGEILSEQEISVRTFGKQLSRVRNISGATVLSDGKVVPVLNVPDLMQSAIQMNEITGESTEPQPKEEERSILVVEDSITSRSLLKNILESAGYKVKTAVDGIDAFISLKTEQFDLVVSDVDMPRMNGFDLTAKIRSEKKMADLPVVLVTALDSKEDRERGIDVGASAYIVKSSFDQSNLLEVLRRLL